MFTKQLITGGANLLNPVRNNIIAQDIQKKDANDHYSNRNKQVWMLLGFAIESQLRSAIFHTETLCCWSWHILNHPTALTTLRPPAACTKNHQSHLMAGENMTIITEKAIEFAGGLTVYTFCLKGRFKSLFKYAEYEGNYTLI